MRKKKFRVDLKQFNFERNVALKSMNGKRIRLFAEKYELNGLLDSKTSVVFWAAVHKAITGIVELPIALRLQSKEWLDKHRMTSFDDGELERILADGKK